MPARGVENKDGMRAGRNGLGDFLEMLVHGFGVGVGHDEPSAHPTVRADRAEQIGPLVARIAHGAGPCSFSRLVSVPFCPTRASTLHEASTVKRKPDVFLPSRVLTYRPIY